MNTLAVIQARTGSTRLPGKVLLDLGGRTVLERVVQRVRAAHEVDEVVVATTTAPADQPIVSLCEHIGIACVRGSENDVLDRFYQAARMFHPRRIARITADCPLLDPAVVDLVLREHERSSADYASNTLEPTFPDGLDVEVFLTTALERAWREAALPSEREHVTPYLWKNPHIFRLASVKHTTDLSSLRWTLDEPEDYRFIAAVYESLLPTGELFDMNAVLALIAAQPHLAMLNARFRRNEGYEKSVRADACTPEKGEPR